MATKLNSAKIVRGYQRKLDKKQNESLGMSADTKNPIECAAIAFTDKCRETVSETYIQEGRIEVVERELDSNSRVKEDFVDMHKNNNEYIKMVEVILNKQ